MTDVAKHQVTVEGVTSRRVAAQRPGLDSSPIRYRSQAGNKLVEGGATVTAVAEGAVL